SGGTGAAGSAGPGAAGATRVGAAGGVGAGGSADAGTSEGAGAGATGAGGATCWCNPTVCIRLVVRCVNDEGGGRGHRGRGRGSLHGRSRLGGRGCGGRRG
ncbi:unnamed protein product, partial [Closterium sp. NIES-54]